VSRDELLDSSGHGDVARGSIEPRSGLGDRLSNLRNGERRHGEQNKAEEQSELSRLNPLAKDPIKYLHHVLDQRVWI
jgi:hypothetical protein